MINQVKVVGLWIFIAVVIGYSLFALIKIVTSQAPDFLVYYTAAVHMRNGFSLYTSTPFTLFAYPPLSALFYIPFALLSFTVAQALFLTCSYIAIFATVYLCFVILKLKYTLQKYLAVVVLTLLAFPTKFTLGMGQSNFIAYFFVLLAVLLEERKQHVLSGIALGIGCIFKPIFIFFLVYFFLKKAWKTILSFLGIGIFFLVLQFLFFPNAFASWHEYIFNVLPHLFTSYGREVYYNQGIMGFVARMTPIFILRSWITIASIFTLLATVLFTIKKTLKDNLYHLVLLSCTLVLIDSLSWQHHFIVLLFPFLFAAVKLHKSFWVVTGIVVSYILVSSNIRSPQLFTHFPFFFILSHTFYGTILLMALLLFGKRSKM